MQGRRGWVWIGLLLAVGVIAVFVRLHRQGADVASSAGETTRTPAQFAAQTVAPQSESGRPNAAVASRNARKITQVDSPPAKRLAILRPLAEGGDIDAMRELGQLYAACRQWRYGPDELLQKRVLAAFERKYNHLPQSDAERKELDAGFLQEQTRRDDCAKLSDEELAAAAGWTEKAARAGDRDATFQYAEWWGALGEFSSREDVLNHLDEVLRRRGIVRELLQAMLDRGDCTALRVYSEAYSGEDDGAPGIFDPDPVAKMAYAWAFTQYSNAMFANPEGVEIAEEGIQSLPPEKRDQARALGQRLLDRYCRR